MSRIRTSPLSRAGLSRAAEGELRTIAQDSEAPHVRLCFTVGMGSERRLEEEISGVPIHELMQEHRHRLEQAVALALRSASQPDSGPTEQAIGHPDDDEGGGQTRL